MAASRHNAPTSALASARLDKQIIERKDAGLSFQEIADELGFSKAYIHRRFHKIVRAIPEEAASEYRANQLAEIALNREIAAEIRDAEHPLVSQGRVIYPIEGWSEDGKPIYGDNPLLDDGPRLAAIDRLEKLRDSEAKLLGLYPAAKVDATVDGGIRVEVVGVSPEDVV